MQTSKQVLRQDVHKKTAEKTEPKVTRIIVWSPAVVQQGRYLSQRCQETCEQRVWLFLDIFSTPAPRSALGWHFKLYHLSQERNRLLWRALHPTAILHAPPFNSRDTTPVLGSCAWKEKTKISPVGGLELCLCCLIDSKGVTSCWSCKARSCLFIYLSIRISK